MSILVWPLAGAIVLLAGLLGARRRIRDLMLTWYLAESRNLEFAERPRDTIKTYPMF